MPETNAPSGAMDAEQILKVLPHRYPFLLIDRIESCIPAERAVGIKCVTHNEPFFQGHFPGMPVMPGVLIQESMVQVAATMGLVAEPGSQVALLGVDKFRVRRPVTPGDVLRIEAQVLKVKGTFWRVGIVATVDGNKVAEGEFLAAVGKDTLSGKS